MRLCPQCKRLVEDEKHLICPDCGAQLPEPVQASSEDADDGQFAQPEPEPQTETGWTDEQALAWYRKKQNEIDKVRLDMPKLNTHLNNLAKFHAGNKFTMNSQNAVVHYQQRLISLAVDFYQLLDAAIYQIEHRDGEQS